ACLRVSKIPPKRDPEASEVEESVIGGEQMLMTNQQATELPEPGVGSLHDPAPPVAAEFASVFMPSLSVLAPVWCDQFNAALVQPLAQRVGIETTVGNHALGLLPRAALGPRDADFRERVFRKRNFCRRGTFQPNSQRNTFTVCQYHPLRSLITLGFTDREAPFFAGAKLPSRNVFIPPQQSFLIQPSQQGTPSVEPDALLLPLLQPPP